MKLSFVASQQQQRTDSNGKHATATTQEEQQDCRSKKAVTTNGQITFAGSLSATAEAIQHAGTSSTVICMTSNYRRHIVDVVEISSNAWQNRRCFDELAPNDPQSIAELASNDRRGKVE